MPRARLRAWTPASRGRPQEGWEGGAGYLRKSLRCTRGDMANHREHNPYGPVGIWTQSRFVNKPETKPHSRSSCF
jgi:hypothetical protein